MALKVIGAGLPRTATLTQKVALEMLGFGPCYHMVNVLGNLDLLYQWRAALNGDADWEQIFGDCQSEVDWPGSFYYKELMAIYPDAKVLLSVRPADAWDRSMRATILDTVTGGDTIAGHLSCAARQINKKWDDYLSLMTDMWIRQGVVSPDGRQPLDLERAFVDHTEQVKQAVPEDKLLVWTASDGWEPLCEFLEVDVPDAPFPRLNDSDTYTGRIIDMSLGTVGNWWTEQKSAAEGAAASA